VIRGFTLLAILGSLVAALARGEGTPPVMSQPLQILGLRTEVPASW
jgi:hypothetical protein